jgi:hypothetical protein
MRFIGLPSLSGHRAITASTSKTIAIKPTMTAIMRLSPVTMRPSTVSGSCCSSEITYGPHAQLLEVAAEAVLQRPFHPLEVAAHRGVARERHQVGDTGGLAVAAAELPLHVEPARSRVAKRIMSTRSGAAPNWSTTAWLLMP